MSDLEFGVVYPNANVVALSVVQHSFFQRQSLMTGESGVAN
jgi:hypothetical protein